MRERHTIISVSCDRCSPQGSSNYPKRSIKRFFPSFSRRVTAQTERRCLEILRSTGWWIGRKWHLCPRCRVIEKKVSRKGMSKVVPIQSAVL